MTINILYAQSGGVTPVINATAAGVIAGARAYPDSIGRVIAAQNGIMGVLEEALIDTAVLSDTELNALADTPGGAFGSCRYQLKNAETHPQDYERILHVFAAHQIGAVLYNGGGDSQDTSAKLAAYARSVGYPLQVLGLPKTIDNDLWGTDHCPGFGSVAKYVAVSIREAALDLQAMYRSSTQVFILEVMGRHAGWITAGAGLAATPAYEAPHLLLFPERSFDPADFIAQIRQLIRTVGYAAIVVSEGIRYADGQYVAGSGKRDAFGHAQLGGAGHRLAQLIGEQTGYKTHVGVADYLQRAARHMGSATDREESYAMGWAAIEALRNGVTDQMITINRVSDQPYQIAWGQVPLADVANREKTLPDDFIHPSGYHITEAARRYLLPLIQGEAYPPYQEGLPQYWRRSLPLISPRCPPYDGIRSPSTQR